LRRGRKKIAGGWGWGWGRANGSPQRTRGPG